MVLLLLHQVVSPHLLHLLPIKPKHPYHHMPHLLQIQVHFQHPPLLPSIQNRKNALQYLPLVQQALKPTQSSPASRPTQQDSASPSPSTHHSDQCSKTHYNFSPDILALKSAMTKLSQQLNSLSKVVTNLQSSSTTPPPTFSNSNPDRSNNPRTAREHQNPITRPKRRVLLPTPPPPPLPKRPSVWLPGYATPSNVCYINPSLSNRHPHTNGRHQPRSQSRPQHRTPQSRQDAPLPGRGDPHPRQSDPHPSRPDPGVQPPHQAAEQVFPGQPIPDLIDLN